MRFLFFVLLLSSSAVAQEITTWKSQSGSEIQAEFYSLDEQKGTVTLLVQRTIPLDQLELESRILAKMLGNRNKPFPGLTTPLEPDLKLSQWKAATESDRRAHIAFLVVALQIQHHTTMRKLDEFAEFMHTAMSRVAAERDPKLPDPKVISLIGEFVKAINNHADDLKSKGEPAR